MELYITEISKYVITLMMALYAYESFAVFRFREEERRGGIYTRQNLLMLAVHFPALWPYVLKQGISAICSFIYSSKLYCLPQPCSSI